MTDTVNGLSPEQVAKAAGLIPGREQPAELYARAEGGTPPAVIVIHAPAPSNRQGRKPVPWAMAALLAFLITGMLAAALAAIGVGPATGTAHAAERAAPASIPLAGASGTLWVGMQALPVTVGVSGSRSGVPHPCVHNLGPDPVDIADYSITDARHTISVRDHLLGKGDTYCWAKGHVTLPARLYVMGVDQNNGQGGKLNLTIRRVGSAPAPAPRHHKAKPRTTRHLQPVTPNLIVAQVQSAAGGLAVDGDYGPLTDARLSYIAAHGRSMPATVARVQRALGISADGVVGPVTRDKLMQLHNAAYGRY